MPVDIEALKALCEKATPGPWDTIGPIFVGVVASNPNWEDGTECLEVMAVKGWEGRYENYENDCALVAAARTAVPDLIAEVKTLRVLVAEALDFDHAAGCLLGPSDQDRCVRGWREWLVRAKKAIGE